MTSSELAHDLPQDNEQLREKLMAVIRPYTFAEDSLVNELLELYESEQTRLKAELIAKLRESFPQANPREWAGNQPQMAWTLGFEKAITELSAALDTLERGA